MTSSGLQCEVTGNDTGDAAQVAAAHCPNERTLDPAVCSYRQSHAIMPKSAALWPSPRNDLRRRLAILVTSIYHVLIATHLPTPKGWKAELT